MIRYQSSSKWEEMVFLETKQMADEGGGHHAKYYQKLDAVRTKGDCEGWISFYLKAIKESAEDACKKAREIEKLEKQLTKKVVTSKNFSLPENQAKWPCAATHAVSIPAING